MEPNSTHLLHYKAEGRLDRFIGGRFERVERRGEDEIVTSGYVLEIKSTFSSSKPWKVRVVGSSEPVQKFRPDDFINMAFDTRRKQLRFSGYKPKQNGKRRKDILITFFPAPRKQKWKNRPGR